MSVACLEMRVISFQACNSTKDSTKNLEEIGPVEWGSEEKDKK